MRADQQRERDDFLEGFVRGLTFIMAALLVLLAHASWVVLLGLGFFSWGRTLGKLFVVLRRDAGPPTSTQRTDAIRKGKGPYDRSNDKPPGKF